MEMCRRRGKPKVDKLITECPWVKPERREVWRDVSWRSKLGRWPVTGVACASGAVVDGSFWDSISGFCSSKILNTPLRNRKASDDAAD